MLTVLWIVLGVVVYVVLVVVIVAWFWSATWRERNGG